MPLYICSKPASIPWRSAKVLDNKAKVKDLLLSGKSCKEISETTGLSKTSSSKYIRLLIDSREVDKHKISNK